MKTNHLMKISAAWVSIAYVVCYVLFYFIPALRGTFIYYAVHMDIGTAPSVFTLGNFVGGLVFWNVLVVLSIWLWAFLAKRIKN